MRERSSAAALRLRCSSGTTRFRALKKCMPKRSRQIDFSKSRLHSCPRSKRPERGRWFCHERAVKPAAPRGGGYLPAADIGRNYAALREGRGGRADQAKQSSEFV